MHPAALDWVTRQLRELRPRTVLDLGSRDVNGSARGCIQAERWHGIDLHAGPGVDEIADAALYVPDWAPDAIVCTEMLEHTRAAAVIVRGALQALAPGGALLVTAACDPRAPHSAEDGGPLRRDEFYKNVSPVEWATWLDASPFRESAWTLATEWHRDRGDFYALVRKPAATGRIC